MTSTTLALFLAFFTGTHALTDSSLPVEPTGRDASLAKVGPRGMALVFDGVDDVVTVPASDALRYPGRGGWTFELWVCPIAFPEQGETAVFGQESVGVVAHDPYSLRIHPGWFEFRVDGPNGGQGIVRFELPLGEWSHVACVYENSGRADRFMSVFVNARRVGREQVSVRMESRTDPVFMGRLVERSFSGGIDEPRVWSYAMSEPEVIAAMHADVNPSDHRLRGWWSFDEPRGGITLDRSPRGSHGLLGNPLNPHDATAPARVISSAVQKRCGRGWIPSQDPLDGDEEGHDREPSTPPPVHRGR